METFQQKCNRWGFCERGWSIAIDHNGAHWVGSYRVPAGANSENAAIVAALVGEGLPVPRSLLGEIVDDVPAPKPTPAPDDLALSRRILAYIKNMSVATAFDCVHEITGGADGNAADARDYAVVSEQLNACAQTIDSMIKREEAKQCDL